MKPPHERDTTPPVDTPLPAALISQIRALCAESAAELQSGRKGNVAQLARRIGQDGRPQLLTELFVLRSAGLSEEVIGQIAIQWKTAFPEFRGINGPRLSPITDEPQLAASTKSKSIGEAEKTPSEDSTSLPLEVHRQIDAACMRFETALRTASQPEVSVILSQRPSSITPA